MPVVQTYHETVKVQKSRNEGEHTKKLEQVPRRKDRSSSPFLLGTSPFTLLLDIPAGPAFLLA